MSDQNEPKNPADTPFYRKWLEGADASVAHKWEKANKSVSEWAHENLNMRESQAQNVVPVAGGLAAGLIGMALIKPLTAAGKALMKGAKALVTGFGYLEKIPVLGGLFTALGKGVEALGDYTGIVFSALAGAATFRALQLQPEEEKNSPSSFGPGAPAAVLGGALAVAARPPVEHAGVTFTPLQNAFKNNAGKPATLGQSNTLERLVGRDSLDKLHDELTGRPRPADGSVNFTRQQAEVLTDAFNRRIANLTEFHREAIEAAGRAARGSSLPSRFIYNTPLIGKPTHWLLRKVGIASDYMPKRWAQTLAEAQTATRIIAEKMPDLIRDVVGEIKDVPTPTPALNLAGTEAKISGPSLTPAEQATVQGHYDDWMKWAKTNSPEIAGAVENNDALRQTVMDEYARQFKAHNGNPPLETLNGVASDEFAKMPRLSVAAPSSTQPSAPASSQKSFAAYVNEGMPGLLDEQPPTASKPVPAQALAKSPGIFSAAGRWALGGLGTGLFGMTGVQGAARAINSLGDNDLAGAGIGLTQTVSSGAGMAVSGANIFGKLTALTERLPFVGAVVTASEGAYHIHKAKTPEEKADYATKTAVMTGVNYGGGLVAAGAVAAAAPAAVVGVALAAPATLAVGATLAADEIIETRKALREFDRVLDERFSSTSRYENLKAMPAMLLSELKTTGYQKTSEGAFDFNDADNLKTLRGLIAGKLEHWHRVQNENSSILPDIVRWGDSALEEKSATIQVKMFGSALDELNKWTVEHHEIIKEQAAAKLAAVGLPLQPPANAQQEQPSHGLPPAAQASESAKAPTHWSNRE